MTTTAQRDGTDPQELLDAIVRALAEAAPTGWERLDGVFSIAGDEEAMQVVARTSQHAHSVPLHPDVAEMIRRHRRASVGAEGPWLRLMIECDTSGNLRVGFDYGAVELPAGYLLSGAAYRRDIDRYPRAVPLWLLAHMSGDGRQLRNAAQARASAALGIGEARRADDELPAMPVLWARIAVVAAVGRGSGATSDGAVGDPSFQRFSGEAGGCLLARLPGDRGVLSGGYDASRLLSAAYEGTIPWPDLYRGAPAWVHNLYLDPRAAAGRMSFCYWWFDGHWYRAELAGAGELSGWSGGEESMHGLPSVWTAESTAAQVNRMLQAAGFEIDGHSGLDLVAAAESGTVSPEQLARLFSGGVPASFDMAEALAQLDAADILHRDRAPGLADQSVIRSRHSPGSSSLPT